VNAFLKLLKLPVKLILRQPGLRKRVRKQVKAMRLRLMPLVARYNSRNGVLAVDICKDTGMGAKLEWCLEILAYCDAHKLRPQVRFSYLDSGPDEDYFGPYFSLRPQVSPARFTRIHHIRELGLDRSYDEVLTLESATRLLEKYLTVKKDVLDEVDAFCAQHFAGASVLGIHYRGTDKREEAPVVSYDRVVRNAEYYLQRFPATGKVFISTDESAFILYMQQNFMSRPVITRDDAFRSQNGTSIHRRLGIDRYAMNRDAVVNCLLLARCDALLKTASIVSDWSKLFNPRLGLVLLNRPYDQHLWFPARELVKDVLFEPVE